jgi:superfamily II DNA or RNA helicase
MKKIFIDSQKARNDFASVVKCPGAKLSHGGAAILQAVESADSKHVQLRGHVNAGSERFETKLLFHRLTSALEGSHCSCSGEALCCHAYALLVSFEDFHKDLATPSGLIDISKYFVMDEQLQIMKKRSLQAVEKQEEKENEKELERQKTSAHTQWIHRFKEMNGNDCDTKYRLQIHFSNIQDETVSISISLVGIGDVPNLSLPSFRCLHNLLQGRHVKGCKDEVTASDIAQEDLQVYYRIYRHLEITLQGWTLPLSQLPSLLFESAADKPESYFFPDSSEPLLFSKSPFHLVLEAEEREGLIYFSWHAYSEAKEELEGTFLEGYPLAFLSNGSVFFLAKHLAPKTYSALYSLVKEPLPKNLLATIVKQIGDRLFPLIQFGDSIPTHEQEALDFQVTVSLAWDGTEILIKILPMYGSWQGNVYGDKEITFSDTMEICRNLEEEASLLELLLKDASWRPSKASWAIAKKTFPSYYSQVICPLQDKVDFTYGKSLKNKMHNVSLNESLSLEGCKNPNFFELSYSCPDLPCPVPLSLLRSILKTGNSLVDLDDHGWFLLEKLPNEDFLDLAEDCGMNSLDSSAKLVIPTWNIGAFIALQDEDFLKFDKSSKNTYFDLKKKLENGDHKRGRKLPENFSGNLRHYQEEGFKWLTGLNTLAFHGILADEMGLGKTVQAITMLLSDKEAGCTERSIIVCPTSLLKNWTNEIERFAPTMKVLLVQGSQEERADLINSSEGVDIIVTSYPQLQRDRAHYEHFTFNYLILDEAQHIKNPATQNAKAAKSLNANHRLVLTGTPIENSVKDLWSLFEFLMPGFFPSMKKFLKLYQTEDPLRLKRLQNRIAPFVLRRYKKDVLDDLPAITHVLSRCEMEDDQKLVYAELVKTFVTAMDEKVAENGEAKSRMLILAGLTRLKQICCHPQLLNLPVSSAKFELLMELIFEMLDGNHRAVIFSQYVSMLHLIRKRLDEENISYAYLDGKTKERQDVVDRFNSDESISFFLVSLKAGGTGLNITGADRVIHYDLWWNPAVENQATDRVHRIGQKRHVMSYKLLTLGTIEEKIMKLQEQKKIISDQLVTASSANLEKVDWKTLKSLLTDD